MKFWTAHIRASAAPVLVREGFSWAALLFGPLWLAAHRVWIPAALAVAAAVLIVLSLRGDVAGWVLIALVLLLGLSGHDLRRWSLDHRGYLQTQVIAARNETEALQRLLERRPDLAGSFMPPQSAR